MDARWLFKLVLIALAGALLAGCASRPPERQENLCEIFRQHPRWYDHAHDSQEKWGTPIPILMAFMQQESSFQRRARPPRERFLGVIPRRRTSSAFGYAQAQDPAWEDYVRATGNRSARRTNISDALDFIGWYNSVSHRRLGLAHTDARNLYLAYHQGHTGFQRGGWRNNPQLIAIADRVNARSQAYATQLASCEAEFRCRRWYQFRPFCR